MGTESLKSYFITQLVVYDLLFVIVTNPVLLLIDNSDLLTLNASYFGHLLSNLC